MPEKKIKVAALVACHNEEKTITTSLISLVQQSYSLAEIICVDDASCDNTYYLLKQLSKSYKKIKVFRCTKNRFRAAALNIGLKKIKKSIDYVLTIDADTQLKKDAVKKGLLFFKKFQKVGGVCSRAGLKKGSGILYRIQKLEYGAGFDAERTATFDNVMVLHGMCTIFDRKALTAIGGFTEGHLIEDYDITLKLKESGFKTMFNPAMEAYTLPPNDLMTLVKQRLRWARGGIDIIIEHGISRFTFNDVLDHLMFILLLALIIIMIVTSMLKLLIWHYQPHPLAILLGLVTYLVHLYRLKFIKNLEWQDYLLRIFVLPELAMSMIYSGVQIYAYWISLVQKKRSW